MENIDELDMAIGRYFAFALVGRMLEAGLFDALSRGAPKRNWRQPVPVEPPLLTRHPPLHSLFRPDPTR
jgi:hypothetical protein